MLSLYSLYFVTLIVCILATDDYERQQYKVNYHLNDNINQDDISQVGINQGFFDPKEYFFRSMRSYDSENNADYEDLPKPGGFNVYAANKDNSDDNKLKSDIRNRREATENLTTLQENSTSMPEEETTLQKQMDKPLELENLDLENATLTSPISTPKIIESPEEIINIHPPSNVLQINDFIRFKRGLESTNQKNDTSKNERETEFTNNRSGKMLLSPDDVVYSGNREPRRAMKNQWFKQPYSIESKLESSYEDVSSSASENVRAPRVHFVTQRRSESSATPVYRQFNYEGNRNTKDSPIDPLLNPLRNQDRDFYVRQSRHYDPYPPPPNYYSQRRDPYYRFDEFRRYEQKYDPIDRDEGYNKQRRIIYYASLPEIVRSPPNVDLRDRYVYRDRYDDRYVTSRPLSVSTDTYRYRKGGYTPAPKARFEENDRTKATSYPVKVSTDVNVREIKKNPERRIYSQSEQRYAYKTPTYPENTYAHL